YGFQFTSSQFVHFECQVKPCVHSCRRQQCEPDTTKVPLIPALRRRREEAEKSGNLTTLRMQTVLQIEPQQLQRAALVSSKRGLDHCVTVNEVLFIAILILGAVTALAILLCFVCPSSKSQIRRHESAYSVANVFPQ
ncbi:hypothetical protein OESDEN_19307, partial [Oesophagostomum dentatum]